MCFDFLRNIYPFLLFTLRRTEREMIKMFIGLRINCSLFFPISLKLEISDRFFKIVQIPNFIKIRPVEPRVVVCKRTDMTKLIVFFRNFVNERLKTEQGGKSGSR